MNTVNYIIAVIITMAAASFFTAIVLEYKERWEHSFYALLFSFALLATSLIVLMWLSVTGEI